tara:strand:+ start:1933 stop:2922 length:990 start_codon:yes stop_codon:yes gene_type:complete
MRYFSYVAGEKWCINSLLTTARIKETFNNLPLDWAAFASIQNYDALGKIISCPLYIDIDSSSLYDAWTEAKNTWANLKSDFDIEPHIFFSGSKGFHIIMPFLIQHEFCHEIAGTIAKDYCTDLDKSVYTSRRLWRCNGSVNAKTGMYKIKVPSIKLSLDEIVELSKKGEKERFKEHEFKFYSHDFFNDLVKEESDFLKSRPIQKISSLAKPLNIDNLKPCIQALWNKTEIADGDRHNTLYLLARTTVAAGLNLDESLALFFNHKYWGKSYPKNLVNKVVYSTHNAGHSRWNCHRGSDYDMLADNCIGRTCFFHRDFVIGLNEKGTCVRI